MVSSPHRPLPLAPLLLVAFVFVGCALAFEDYGLPEPGAGGGGSGGDGVVHGDAQLGDACDDDSVCRAGLFCWRRFEQVPGPSGGVCTKNCVNGCPAGSTCHDFEGDGDMCMKTCAYGAGTVKCGRADFACIDAPVDHCLPMCSDEACGDMLCDARSGLCSSASPVGRIPFGHGCDRFAADDLCIGECRGLQGTCERRCVVGSDAACNGEGACLPRDDEGSDGDVGSCRRYCGCSQACAGEMACDADAGDEGGSIGLCKPFDEVQTACPWQLSAMPVLRYPITQGDFFAIGDNAPGEPFILQLLQSFGGQPYIFKQQGHTSLASDVFGSGRAVGILNDTKAYRLLLDAEQLTIEMVLQATVLFTGFEHSVFDVGGPVGPADKIRVSIGRNNLEEPYLALYFNFMRVRTWPLTSIDALQPHVYHLIWDTGQAAPIDRARLYVDGTLFIPDSNQPLSQHARLGVDPSDEMSLINDWLSQGSLVGRVFHFALYRHPFSPALAAAHAGALELDDDLPLSAAPPPDY